MNTNTTTAGSQGPSRPTARESLQGLVSQAHFDRRLRELLKDRTDQFVSSLIQVGNTMPDVAPRSILAAAMQAAALDLPINKNLGFAWIVPYREGREKLAQFQMGYRGYIQLALRTGVYARMNARALNEAAFVGWDPIGEPILDWRLVDEAEPVAGYAFAFKLTNTFTKVAYWPRKRVELHAERYSQSYRSAIAARARGENKETPWNTHFDEMGLKTVVANELRRWGLLSIHLERAYQSDQSVRADVDERPMIEDAEGGSDSGESGPVQSGDEGAERAMGLAPEVGIRVDGRKDDQALLLAAEVSRQAKAAKIENTPPTPVQEQLAQVCRNNGIEFDQFRKFLGQFLRDADSLADWAQVPAENCRKWLKSGEAELIQAIRGAA